MDLAELGKQFGLDAAQTQAAIDALAPVVAAGIRRNTQDDGGFADLISALARGNHAQYVDDPAVLESPVVIDDGNAILGHVFGSKDVSRGVAQQLSASSGIGASVLKKLLPIVAAMVMGQIAKKALGGGAPSRAPAPAPAPEPSGGSLGDILGQVLGGGQPSSQGQGGGLGDILGDILSGGQGGAQRPTRAPAPGGGGGGGGLGDILGDILGGGQGGQGRAQPAPGGPSIEDLLKD
ncbi:MAG: DUF937 domain-containing protein, partial [Alphaproteobacteria bacterium]|nr:DUF937 domain-containing protein [Alphaproteobacteria bacterium]